jgi:hypothetical protein
VVGGRVVVVVGGRVVVVVAGGWLPVVTGGAGVAGAAAVDDGVAV